MFCGTLEVAGVVDSPWNLQEVLHCSQVLVCVCGCVHVCVSAYVSMCVSEWMYVCVSECVFGGL